MPLNSATAVSFSCQNIDNSSPAKSTPMEVGRGTRPISTLSNGSIKFYGNESEMSDIMKLQVLEDPYASAECKRKIREDLARKGNKNILANRNDDAVLNQSSRGNSSVHSSKGLPSSYKKIDNSKSAQNTSLEAPQRHRVRSTHSSSSGDSYVYQPMPDTLKLKVLEDPRATKECKQKIKEDLAKKGKIDISAHGTKHTTMELTPCKNEPVNPGNRFLSSGEEIHDSKPPQNILLEAPLRPRKISRNSSSSEESYEYKPMPDILKLKVLNDPCATEECKQKIRDDLARRGKLP